MTDEFFHDGSQELQERFDTSRIAGRIIEKFLHDTIDEDDRQFIGRLDMFFLATADDAGRPNCSYKGGEPGFVRVVDDHTIAFPIYDGNGMYISTGNTFKNPAVGLLFIDFQRGHRMRLNGDASIDFNDPLISEYPEAQFIVRVKVREIFPNCPRYIHKLELVKRSHFLPRVGMETPVPDWKKDDWAQGYLPESTPPV